MKASFEKSARAAAAIAVVLGMTIAPAAAFADTIQAPRHIAKFDHGRGGHDHGDHGDHEGHNKQGNHSQAQVSSWSSFNFASTFNLKGLASLGSLLNSGSDDHHGHGHISLPNTLIDGLLQQAVKYYDPLVQSDEQKLQAEIQLAGQSSTSTTGAVATSNEVSVEQQIQADLTAMGTATSAQQLVDLAHQVQSLADHLQEQVKASANEDGQLPAAVHEASNQLTQIQRRYDGIYTKVQAILGQASGGTSLSLRGDALATNVLRQYVSVSIQSIRKLELLNARLTRLVDQVGTTQTPNPVTATVAAAKSSVQLSASSITAGGNLTVTGIVEDANGAPIASSPVAVSFDGKSMQATTAANGAFTATLVPTQAVSSAPVTVTAGGVTISSATSDVTVTAGAPTAITTSSSSPTSVTAGSKHAVTYTVLDQYGNPVPNATVNFSLIQSVGLVTEAQTSQETSELLGAISADSSVVGGNSATAVTNQSGQVTVYYTADTTADSDGDLNSTISANTGSPVITNSQTVFTY